jgi:hypothetical protein
MNNNEGFSNLIIIGLVLAVIIVGVVGYFILIPKPTTFPQGDQGKPEPLMTLAPYVDVEATVLSLFLDDLHSHCKAPEVCPRDRITLRIDKVIDNFGLEFPPSFRSNDFTDLSKCEEVQNFLEKEKSLYLKTISQCKKVAVWVGPELPQGRPETRHQFSGVFSVEINRRGIDELQKILRNQFESELSISPYVTEGDELEFILKYSARPAKLRSDIPPTCPTGWIFKSGSCIQEDCEGPECVAFSPQYSEKPAELENDYIVYRLPQRTNEVTEKILSGLEESSKIKIRIWQPLLMSREIGEYEIIP